MAIKLSKRLKSCAGFLPDKYSRLIDVGCDHGLLAVHELQNQKCGQVLAIDIEAAPLRRAELAFARHGLEEQSSCFLNNGLKGVELKAGDRIVIAGMGGLEICDILSHCELAAYLEAGHEPTDLRLVVQPMKSQALLRVFLSWHGFVFQGESLVKERGRIYTIGSYTFPRRTLVQDIKDRLLDESDDEALLKLRRQAVLSCRAALLGERLDEILSSSRFPVLTPLEQEFVSKQKEYLEGFKGTAAFISGLGHIDFLLTELTEWLEEV